MKTLLFVAFLFCLGCSKEEISPASKSIVPAQITIQNSDGSTRMARSGDCSTNLAIVEILQYENSNMQGEIALIRYGILPNTGCSKEIQSAGSISGSNISPLDNSCIGILTKWISFNNFQIQLLKAGC